MGKSRLLEEWRQHLTAHGVTYLEGRCWSYGSATPYLPVLDMLRAHCGITPVDGGEVTAVKVSVGLQAVGMVPDAWAPYLLHLLGVGAETVPEHLPQAILAKAQGNPFFLEEIAQTLVDQGTLQGGPIDRSPLPATPVADLQLPPTVQGVLAARIDRLPPEEKRLLQAAAVIGTEVPLPLLQALTELPDAALHRGLAHLQTAEFLYERRLFPEHAYTFKHALTHEVAYSSLLQERRRVLHARIVEAIEALYPDRLADQVERLAHHALRGEVWDKALVYCRQAGEKTMERSAYREAVAYIAQALTALARLPERRDTREQAIDLRCDLRNALLPLGEQARSFNHLRKAEAFAERLGDDQRLSRIAG
jgi:predicted ATPase